MSRYSPTNDVRNLSVDLAADLPIEIGARTGGIKVMRALLQGVDEAHP